MFARISSYHGAPGKMKEGHRIIEEITPEMQQMAGFQRAYLFIDDRSGKAITLSLWGTEEEANRSLSPTGQIRDRILRALGGSGTPNAETFELAVEIGQSTGSSRFARVSTYRGSSGKVEDGIRAVRETESTLKQMQGFQQAFFFADRKSGKAMTMTFWDSETAVSRSSSGANPLRDSIAQALGTSENPTVEVFQCVGRIEPRQARRAA